jgi:alkylation response protein AidB-like acyl-CoA dehydrogenase
VNLDLTEDQLAVRELFATFFARESSSEVVRASEPLGFAPALWAKLRDTGALSISVGEEAGGGGAGLFESALVAEQAGRRLAPIPFAEHVASARVLERASAPPEVLAAVVGADEPATLAPWPVHDDTRLVPAAAVARSVIAYDDRHDTLLLADNQSHDAAIPNLAGLPLAELTLPGTVSEALASGAHAQQLFARAVDEWRVLVAAMLVGAADAAFALGVEYVKTRHQFGVPIGSFQVIQHGLAEFVGPIAGARLLVAEAAWAADHDDTELPRLASCAFLFTADLAQRLTARVVHYHGGYGVMAEYDPQLYYRRAKGWPLQLGDPASEYQHLADVLYGPRKEA